MKTVFLITHMQPEDRTTSKNSILLETKWKITLQPCFQANKDEQFGSGQDRGRERGELEKNEQKESEKKTLQLSSNVRGQNGIKLPRCTE